MAGSTKGITIIAKLLGGKKLETETKSLGKSVRETGEDAKKADDDASHSSKGWELFTRKVKSAGDESKKTGSLFKNAASSAVGLFSAYVGYSGVKSIFTSAGDAAEETEKFHAATGASSQSSLEWISVAKSRGIAESRLSQSFVLLSKNVQSAERQEIQHTLGMEKAAAAGHSYTGLLGVQATALHELGLRYQDLNSLSPQKQFSLIAERMSGITNASEKTRIGMQLFGRGVKELLPLMNESSLGLKEQLKIAHEFLPEIGEQGPEAFEKLRLAQARSNMAWQGLSLTIGLKLMPLFLKFTVKFSDLVHAIEKGSGPWGAIETIISGIVKVGKGFYEFLTKTKVGVVVLTGALIALGAIITVNKFIEIVQALKLVTIATKAWAAAVWLVNIAEEADPFVLAITAIVAAIVAVVAAIGVAIYFIVKNFGWIETAAGKVWKFLKSAGLEIFKIYTAPYLFAFHLIEAGFNALVGFFEGVPAKLGRIFVSMWDGMKDAFKAVMNWIITGWDKLKFTIHWPSFLGIGGGSTTIGVPHIPLLGFGGNIASGGSVIVGDRGPEVLNLPSGAQVTPLEKGVGSMAGHVGSWNETMNGDLHVHVECESREIGVATLKEFRRRGARH